MTELFLPSKRKGRPPRPAPYPCPLPPRNRAPSSVDASTLLVSCRIFRSRSATARSSLRRARVSEVRAGSEAVARSLSHRVLVGKRRSPRDAPPYAAAVMTRRSESLSPLTRSHHTVGCGPVAAPVFGPLERWIDVVVAQVPILIGADGQATSRAENLLATFEAEGVLTAAALVHGGVALALTAVAYQPPAFGRSRVVIAQSRRSRLIGGRHERSSGIGGNVRESGSGSSTPPKEPHT